MTWAIVGMSVVIKDDGACVWLSKGRGVESVALSARCTSVPLRDGVGARLSANSPGFSDSLDKAAGEGEFDGLHWAVSFS